MFRIKANLRSFIIGGETHFNSVKINKSFSITVQGHCLLCFLNYFHICLQSAFNTWLCKYNLILTTMSQEDDNQIKFLHNDFKSMKYMENSSCSKATGNHIRQACIMLHTLKNQKKCKMYKCIKMWFAGDGMTSNWNQKLNSVSLNVSVVYWTAELGCFWRSSWCDMLYDPVRNPMCLHLL